jgi:AraC-type DNA-binding domain-containing proteins
MEPYHEILDLPVKILPVNAWIRSSNNELVQAHPHWHDVIEILYIIEGRAEQQINEKIFDAVQGDIIFIQSNDIHSTYTDRSTCNRILVVQFHPSLLSYQMIGPADHSSRPLAPIKHVFPELVKSGTEPGLEILKTLYTILKEMEGEKNGYEMLVRSEVLKLAGLVARHFPVADNRTENPQNMLKARLILKKTFKYIDDNYSSNISLGTAAKASSLSVSHFCRLFKSAAGMTFNEYLSFYRIKRAEVLLSTEMSITQIAYECGFESMSTFIRAFRKFKGCTPSLYKNRLENLLN